MGVFAHVSESYESNARANYCVVLVQQQLDLPRVKNKSIMVQKEQLPDSGLPFKVFKPKGLVLTLQ